MDGFGSWVVGGWKEDAIPSVRPRGLGGSGRTDRQKGSRGARKGRAKVGAKEKVLVI